MKVIIIGAGIAGLTTALACEQVGIEASIYEKAPSLRTIGGGIFLWPHGLRYLKSLNALDKVLNHYVKINGCKIVDAKESVILYDDYTLFYELLGGELLPIGRNNLQQSLVESINKPSIYFNKKCIHAEETNQVATAWFADGTVENADLIIAADGIWSAVRQSVRPSHQAIFSGHSWFGGILDRADFPEVSSDEVYMTMAENKCCIIWPLANKQCMWFLPVRMPLGKEINADNKLSLLKELAQDWAPTVMKLYQASQSKDFFALPIYTVPPTMLGCERIVFVGDAAHATGPIIGQGANTAIEDAFTLITILNQQPKHMSQAIHAFEQLRFNKVKKLGELERASADMMITDAHHLQTFQDLIKHLDLASIYQDLIQLINEQACLDHLQAIKNIVTVHSS